MKTLLFILALTVTGCASAPPSLSPAGKLAFYNTRVVKGLDLLRDTAIDANKEVPPLLDDATTRSVVLYHQSSLKIIQASGAGWKAAVLTGLEQLPQSPTLAPYVSLVKAILAEVP